MADPINPLPPRLSDDYDFSDGFVDDKINAKIRAREQQLRDGQEGKLKRASRARELAQQHQVRASDSARRQQDQHETGRQPTIPQEELITLAESLQQPHAMQTLHPQERIQPEELMLHIQMLLDEAHHDGLDTLLARVEGDPELRYFQLRKLPPGSTSADRLQRVLQLIQKIQAAELRLKLLLQKLAAQALGTQLTQEVKRRFRRLFERVPRWPLRIPPGHIPETDDDWDAFFQWLYAPPPLDVADWELLAPSNE